MTNKREMVSRQVQREPSKAPRSLRILVADDDRDTVLTLMMVLRDEGHDVRGVYTGAQVMSAVKQFEPEVVLLDIALPELSGWEVARRMRSHREKGPLIIGISGEYKFGADKILAQIVGFDHYLTKPYVMDDLLKLLAPLRLPQPRE